MTEALLLIDALARLGVLGLQAMSALHADASLSDETRAALWARIEERNRTINDRADAARARLGGPGDTLDGVPV